MARSIDGMGRMGAEVQEVRFTPPPGMDLDGESGQAVIDWRSNGDGTVSIVAVDGVALSESPETEGEMGEMEEMDEIEET